MVKQLRSAAVILLALTIITGVAYPLVVTAAAQIAFPYQANGSLITRGDVIVGSELIGQQTSDPRYFWSRPSAVNYMQGSSADALGVSSGTNLAPTSATLADAAAQRLSDFATANDVADVEAIPADILFASGSGLDPHISPEAAHLQAARVAEARGLEFEAVEVLIEAHVEPSEWGILGQPRVNVLKLNLALDALE